MLSNIIISRCSLEKEILLQKEYKDLACGRTITNIQHCEIKNIIQNSIVKNDWITVTIKFDLIIVFEYTGMNSCIEYGVHTESAEKKINIDIKLFEPPFRQPHMESFNYRSIIRNVKLDKDIDIFGKAVVISVTSDLDCYILKEDTLGFVNTSVIVEDSSEIKMENRNTNSDAVDVIKGKCSSGEDNLDTYILYMNNLLKKASDIGEINKDLEEKIAVHEKRISYLEYKKAEAEKECSKLRSELNIKEKSIENLKIDLERSQKKVELLTGTNKILSSELENYQKENVDLKAYKDGVEEKRKKSLNYRIKSVINSMKLFS